MSGSGSDTSGIVLGTSTIATGGALLASTGTLNSWIVLTGSITLGISVATIALKLAINR